MRHRFPRLFRPCSAWFDHESDFRAAVGAENPGVEWRVFRWSGENSEIERRRAACDFSEVLRSEIDPSSDDAYHVVIAHSHGGNVALWALGYLDDSRRARIVGLATMGTPFLHYVPRRLSALEERTLTLLLSARYVLFVPVVFLPTALLALLLDPPTLDLASVAPYALLIVSVVYGYLQNHRRHVLARERLQAPLMEPKILQRALALRCRGDEAARAIAAAEKGAALFLRAWAIVRLSTRVVQWDDARWRRRALRVAAGACLALIGIGCAQAVIVPERFAEFAAGMARGFPGAWMLRWWPGPVGLLVLEIVMLPLLIAQIAAILACFPVLLAAPVVYYSQVFLGMAYGRDTLDLAVATEIRVDTQPSQPSMPVEFMDRDDRQSAHSVHALPAARRRLADWIRRCQVESTDLDDA